MKTLFLSIFLALAVSVTAQGTNCEAGCAQCTTPFGLSIPDECQLCDEANGYIINSAGTLCIEACPFRQFAGVNNEGRRQCRTCTQGCSSCTDTGLTVDVCQACDEVLGWNLNLAETTCVQSCPLGQFVDLEPARDQCEPCTTGCSSCAGRSLDVRPNGICQNPLAGADCIECNQAIGWRLRTDGCSCVETCGPKQFNDQTTGVDICVGCSTGCAECSRLGLSVAACSLCDEEAGFKLNRAGTGCVATCAGDESVVTNQNGRLQCSLVCTTGCLTCTGLGLTTDVCQVCDEANGWLLNSATDACVQVCGAAEYADFDAEPAMCKACTTGCVECSGDGLTSTVCDVCDEANGWLLNSAADACVQVCGAAEYADLEAEPDMCMACTTGCVECSDAGLTSAVCEVCDEANGWLLNSAADLCVQVCGDSEYADFDAEPAMCMACTTGCVECSGDGLTSAVCDVCDEANGWLWNSAADACVEVCGATEYADFDAEPAMCMACDTGCASCTDSGLEVGVCVCDEVNGFYVSVDGLVCTECTATQYVDFSVDPAACVEFSQSQSRTFGDPHMVGLLGQKYLFDGEAGKIYNVISTPDLQVNMQLIQSHDGEVELAVIGEIGIVVGDDSIFVNKDARLRVNNVLASDITLLSDKKSSLIRDTFHDGKGIIVRTPEFMIRMVPRGYEVDIKEIRMMRRGDKNIHGIVGQTWSATNWPESAFTTEITDQKVLFQGLLEGSSVADYEVKDGLFGANFTFSRFDTVAHSVRHVIPDVSKSQ